MPEISDFERTRARRWVDRLMAQMARESAGTPGTLTLISTALLELHADTTAGTVTEATLAAIAEEIAARSSPEGARLETPSPPVPPDFNAIALRPLVEIDPLSTNQNPATTQQAMASVAEQLRLVWNARGAADLVALDTVLAGAVSMKMVDSIIRALDR